jgi:hypothetical protein
LSYSAIQAALTTVAELKQGVAPSTQLAASDGNLYAVDGAARKATRRACPPAIEPDGPPWIAARRVPCTICAPLDQDGR